MISILIPSHVEEKVIRRLDRLAKKAGVTVERIPGVSTMFQTYLNRNFRTGLSHMDDFPRALAVTFFQGLIKDDAAVMECARYTIGDMPAVSGYTFVAKITHTEGGNIISAAPGERGADLPKELREAAPTCDHCNTKRRRNETFVLRTPDGDLYRCGRNCLADFLNTDPAKIVASAEIAAFFDGNDSAEESDEEYGWGGGGWSIKTLTYLAACISAVEHHGFRKSDSDASTKSRANFLISPRPRGYYSEDLAREWDKEQPTAAHRELAEEIVRWSETMDSSSDYLHNLKVALRCSVAASDRRGILASAPSAYARAMGAIAEKKTRETVKDAGHFGKVGERLETLVTVLRTYDYATNYGTKSIVTFRNDSGHELTWFTTTRHITTNDVGKRFAIKGTVKEHGQYKGRAQTVLSRVKCEELKEESQVA